MLTIHNGTTTPQMDADNCSFLVAIQELSGDVSFWLERSQHALVRLRSARRRASLLSLWDKDEHGLAPVSVDPIFEEPARPHAAPVGT